MRNKQDTLAKELAKNCSSIEDVQDKLKDVFSDTLQEMMEAEMDHHLGYEKHDVQGNNTGNSRNGTSSKQVKTKFGQSEISIPRDRNGEFDPQVLGKYKSSTNDLEDKIIAMYAKGMTTRDIEAHMHDIYGIEVSSSMVSKITDRILPRITEWQSRPLERVYPIVFLDAIHFKVKKDNRIVNKAAYSVLGIDIDGHKDILGIWIGENESSKFWLNVLNDLKNRGVEDILIVCKDGLTGFSEAIESVFPKADNQLCVIHQIRNTLKYVSYKDKKDLMDDLKKVYKALNIEEAELYFEEFKEKWENKYPIVIRSWENNWDQLTAYFKYPHEIRKIIYTTNIIEGYHRQLRKATKTKTAYSTDEALLKVIYLTTMDITKKWNQPVFNWKSCISQLAIHFEDRLKPELPY
ncbi:IS256 family transposase [Natranaerobius trueperi]|uniref:Mutator family transposase n=1 Tax=Natranaerobius trueperi TaxID=759412 RepID=A0A226BUC7_9FIRM|nr:IS256 family transposase [Natranaerobius trueperi]OWZ82638.1 IS256 family transposase [Natranaerobius trueperi]